ncbi:hypothetical protein IU510_30710 [Nocardia cyriacigeorgica]|uniref:hypothetical protein n=1 Tax=Nocardia asiatica TaxID=209252 RepID=UPI001892D8CE|nr:hypothetical protein [Nocardia cyriacigeorgica]
MAGVLDHIRGLVVAAPVDNPRDDAPGETYDELILRCASGNFPIVTGAEFGFRPAVVGDLPRHRRPAGSQGPEPRPARGCRTGNPGPCGPQPRDDVHDLTPCADLPAPRDASGASVTGGCLECADAVG